MLKKVKQITDFYEMLKSFHYDISANKLGVKSEISFKFETLFSNLKYEFDKQRDISDWFKNSYTEYTLQDFVKKYMYFDVTSQNPYLHNHTIGFKNLLMELFDFPNKRNVESTDVTLFILQSNFFENEKYPPILIKIAEIDDNREKIFHYWVIN